MVVLKGACKSDFDCPGNQICYSGYEPWVLNNYSYSFCNCSTWFMWTGPDCLTLSGGSYLTIFLIIVSYFVAIPSLILNFTGTRKFLKGNHAGFNAFAVTLILMFIATLINVIYIAARTYSLVNPAAAIIQRPNDTTKYQGGYWAEAVCLPIFLLATTCSYLHITIVWLDIGSETNVLPKERFDQLIMVWNKFIYFLEVILIAGTIALFIKEFANYFSAWVIPFLLFIGTVTVLGSRFLYSAVKVRGSEEMTKSTYLIWQAGCFMTLVSFIQIIISLIYTSMNIRGWKNFSPIGEITPLEPLSQVAVISSSLMNFALAQYMHRAPAHGSQKTQTTGAIIPKAEA